MIMQERDAEESVCNPDFEAHRPRMAATLSQCAVPVRLDVPVEQEQRQIPESLRARLDVAVTKSSEELAKEAARSKALREAHLEAIKERAGRDIQRAAEAAARKRRMSAAEAQKIILKLEAAGRQAENARQQRSDKIEADKAKRAALAEAVSEQRKAAEHQLSTKALAEAQRAEQAMEKREKLMQAVAERGSAVVKHAAAVVAARKEKETAQTAAAAERLARKLEAAEARREASQDEGTPNKMKHVHAAARRQAHAVDLERKRAVDTAAMEQAAAKRESMIQTIADSAAVFNDHAREVAHAAKAASEGKDEASARVKAAFYEKLVSAEVSRNLALKTRGKRATESHHPEVIEVAVGGEGAIKTPSKELLRRLTACPQNLLATSAARQLGAFSRRELALADIHARSVKRVSNMAATARRRSSARAESLSRLKARHMRSAVMLDKLEKERARRVAKQMALSAFANASRDSANLERSKKAEDAKARCDAATERHEAHLRRVAKVGVASVRAGAFKSRRAALASVIEKNAELHQTRCIVADSIRQAGLGAKIAVAKELGTPRRMQSPVE